jgi:thiamine-monophosphate kinase
MLDLSDGLAVDAHHIARRSGCRVVVDLDRVPLAPGARIEDLGFGEDYELLAAVPSPTDDHREIGRCEEGEGVELRHDGVPTTLAGWDHFKSLKLTKPDRVDRSSQTDVRETRTS